jgi:uncharacterized protein YggU (UPF0235/DUF167 family)
MSQLKIKKTANHSLPKHFPDANINKVHVKTFAGSISVLGKDGSQPRIEMYVNENNQRGTAPSAIEKIIGN